MSRSIIVALATLRARMATARGETVEPHVHYCPECNEYWDCFLSCDDVVTGDDGVSHAPPCFCCDDCRRAYTEREETMSRRREALRRLTPKVSEGGEGMARLARPVLRRAHQGFTVPGCARCAGTDSAPSASTAVDEPAP